MLCPTRLQFPYEIGIKPLAPWLETWIFPFFIMPGAGRLSASNARHAGMTKEGFRAMVRRCPAACSGPAVNVFQPDDIVLAQVGA